jgi:hypothetical protein
MTWLTACLQIVVAVVLITAATGKILQPDEFRQALEASGLSTRVVAPLVPTIELGVGLMFLIAQSRALPVLFAIALGLFGVFSAWIVWVAVRKIRVHCGCFGSRTAEVGYRDILRNLFLAALAGLGLAVSFSASEVDQIEGVWRVAAAVALTLALMLILALRRVRPHLILSMTEFDQLREVSPDAPGR